MPTKTRIKQHLLILLNNLKFRKQLQNRLKKGERTSVRISMKAVVNLQGLVSQKQIPLNPNDYLLADRCLSKFMRNHQYNYNKSYQMSFHVYLQYMEDLHRILTFPQSLFIHIFTNDQSQLQSSVVSSQNPKWNSSYCFLCSDEQKLIFVLKSMEPSLCNQPLCSGEINLKSRPVSYWDQKKVKVIMDGPYNSEVILHIRLVWKSKKVTPFEGITEISGGDGIKKSQNSNGKIVDGKNNSKKLFFKGPCDSVNLFSFLDTRVKGQYFQVLQKQIPK